jgi:ABC-type branched-subunit amino acid transport system substrate-binding protein
VFGRRIGFLESDDDHSDPGDDRARARRLVEDDGVFAIVPVASVAFGAAHYLAAAGVPTFGWAGAGDWNAGPSLFGVPRAAPCPRCDAAATAFVARRKGAAAAAVIGYADPTSSACSTATIDALAQVGVPVVATDTTLAPAFAAAPVAADLLAHGVDLVASCLDVNADVAITQVLRAQGTSGVRFVSNEGYDLSTIAKYGRRLDGFVFAVPFRPFDRATGSASMRAYLDSMTRLERTPNEYSLAGWLAAELLVRGIRWAGRGFDRASVVAAIHRHAPFTARGMVAPITWSAGPSSATVGPACLAFREVVDGRLVSRFTPAGSLYACLAVDGPRLDVDHPVFR